MDDEEILELAAGLMSDSEIRPDDKYMPEGYRRQIARLREAADKVEASLRS